MISGDWKFRYSNIHSESVCTQWETTKHIISFLNVLTTKHHIFGTQKLRIAIVKRTFKWTETCTCGWIIVIEIDWDMKRQCSWHCDAVRRPWYFQSEHWAGSLDPSRAPKIGGQLSNVSDFVGIWCRCIAVIEFINIHDIDHYIRINLQSLLRDGRHTRSDQTVRVRFTADAGSEFDDIQYSWSLFITISTSTVINVGASRESKSTKVSGSRPRLFCILNLSIGAQYSIDSMTTRQTLHRNEIEIDTLLSSMAETLRQITWEYLLHDWIILNTIGIVHVA